MAILEGESPLERVCSVNFAARRMGAQRGMTRAELESFSDLEILRRSQAEEAVARDAAIEAAAVFTPRMEEHTSGVAFVLALDVGGCEGLFGSVHAIVRKLMGALRVLGFKARIAVSTNLPAALCVVRAVTRMVTFIPQGQEAEAMARLPLQALDLTESQAETFAAWGLRTAGELGALPERELVVRIGQTGAGLWRLARGEAEHLMVPLEPKFMLTEVVEFEHSVEGMEALLFVLGPMLDQLIVRAGNHALALASVTVRMSLEGGAEHRRTIKPALPVMDRRVLLKLLQLDLATHPPSAGVMTVHVTAEPGVRSKVQMGLFSPQMPEPMRLDITLARIQALVGEGRVGRVKLVDSHAPESFAMEKFTVSGSQNKTWREDGACTVAVRRMRPPVPVTVMQEHGSMVAFYMGGMRYIVRERYGPWRRSGAWWTSDVWSRDEWDTHAETAGGERLLCVLTHDLLHDDWWMEAVYD